MIDLTNIQLCASLGSTTCLSCGRTKTRGMTFCSCCYHTLPMDQRAKLYRRLNGGYGEAVSTALETLKIATPFLPEGI